MSMHDIIMKAASFAVTEERGRVLWCMEQVLKELKSKLDKKLLTEIQVHAVELKIKIAEAVYMELRRAIISGARPASSGGDAGITGQAGAAVFINSELPNGPQLGRFSPEERAELDSLKRKAFEAAKLRRKIAGGDNAN